MQWNNNSLRYGAFAIILHWLMAIMILSMLFSGFLISDLAHQARLPNATVQIPFIGTPVPLWGDAFLTLPNLFNLHKSFGLSLLLLAILRLLIRIGYGAPLTPLDIPLWQRFAANITHIALYFLMIAIPLSGYLYASTTGFPTDFFLTGIHIPPFPNLENTRLEHLFHEKHEQFAWALIALLILHIAAALKHHFINKDNIMWQMLPFLKNPHKGL